MARPACVLPPALEQSDSASSTFCAAVDTPLSSKSQWGTINLNFRTRVAVVVQGGLAEHHDWERDVLIFNLGNLGATDTMPNVLRVAKLSEIAVPDKTQELSGIEGLRAAILADTRLHPV